MPLRGDFRRIDLHDAEIFFRSDFLKSHLKHNIEKPGKISRGCFQHSGLPKYFFEKKSYTSCRSAVPTYLESEISRDKKTDHAKVEDPSFYRNLKLLANDVWSWRNLKNREMKF